ncbi:MAG: hypothetical protein K2Y08_07165 [Alphaproteobacteria bacterium]|nr:hypothetical protein [Alphaproteobacteria bacterium]
MSVIFSMTNNLFKLIQRFFKGTSIIGMIIQSLSAKDKVIASFERMLGLLRRPCTRTRKACGPFLC